jgi:hypothetical protein
MLIHELADWPNLQWAEERPTLVLAVARYRQGRSIGHMAALGFPFRGEVVLQTLTEEGRKSSEIEGEVPHKERARSSAIRRPDINIARLVEVEGVVAMTLDATQSRAQPQPPNGCWAVRLHARQLAVPAGGSPS